MCHSHSRAADQRRPRLSVLAVQNCSFKMQSCTPRASQICRSWLPDHGYCRKPAPYTKSRDHIRTCGAELYTLDQVVHAHIQRDSVCRCSFRRRPCIEEGTRWRSYANHFLRFKLQKSERQLFGQARHPCGSRVMSPPPSSSKPLPLLNSFAASAIAACTAEV